MFLKWEIEDSSTSILVLDLSQSWSLQFLHTILNNNLWNVWSSYSIQSSRLFWNSNMKSSQEFFFFFEDFVSSNERFGVLFKSEFEENFAGNSLDLRDSLLTFVGHGDHLNIFLSLNLVKQFLIFGIELFEFLKIGFSEDN